MRTIRLALLVGILWALLSDPGGAQTFSGVFQEHYTFDGASAAAAGDVNRDGVPDVIVGQSFASPGQRTHAGSAFVYSGKDGTKLWQFDGAVAEDGLGVSVAGAGDVNQDGHPDVIVNGNPVAVYSGKNGKPLLQLNFSGAKFTVSGAGDVNGDKIPDVIVRARGTSTTFGSAHVYSGKKRALEAGWVARPLFGQRPGERRRSRL